MSSRGGAGGGSEAAAEIEADEAWRSRVRLTAASLAKGSVKSASEARALVDGGGAKALFWLESGGEVAFLTALTDRRLPDRRHLLPPLLSAIADCCVRDDTRRRISKLNLWSELVYILKHATEDQLIGKVCRVIGNLAQDVENAERFHKEGAVSALQNILENDKIETSTPTLTLTIRAIRLMWTVESRQKDMIKNGTIKAVANVLCAHCAKADFVSPKKRPMCKRKNDLFTGLLKCIGYFSKHSTFQCVEQILGDGQGYKCLVSLSKDFESLALQIILNLCYVEECRPLLGTAGVVERLIEVLNSQTDWSSSWVKALSLLCRSHVNRHKLEEHNGFPLLIKIVKDISKLTCHLYALQTFLNFLLDHDAFTILAKEGAIEVFVCLLKHYVNNFEYDHQPDVKKKGKRRKANNFKYKNLNTTLSEEQLSPNYTDDDCDSTGNVIPCKRFHAFPSKNEQKFQSKLQSFKQQSSPNLSPQSDCSSTNTQSPEYNSKNSKYFSTTNNYVYCPESPGSSVDGPTSNYWNSSQWSPASSGLCYSPSSVSQCDEESLDSDWSAHYSPICSDNEEIVTITPIEIQYRSESNEMADALNELIEDDDITQELLKETSNIEKTYIHRIHGLMSLIYMFCFCPSKVTVKLASMELLHTLLNYIKKCKHPHKNIAVTIFNRILSDYTNLRYILKHSVVLYMYDITQNLEHDKCKQCKQVHKIFAKFINQISNVAESDFGTGEISHLLLKGDGAIKETLVLTLPFITKSPRVLKKFYINCEGLEIFLTILSSQKKPLEHCIPALARLAINLTIPAPKPIFGEFKSSVLLNYNSNVNSDSKINFILDDSSIVQANVELLCSCSDVFMAMLQGMFKEANQKCVRLQKVSKESLEYLLCLLESGIHLKSVDVFPLPKSLNVALETLLLTDRFLMDKVKNLLFSAIVQFKLDSTSADKIYIWSLEEGMGTLCMESIAYTLVGKMDDDKRCSVVLTILNSIYKEQWIDDVRYSLLRFMM